MEEAERISKDEHGSDKVAVIAGKIYIYSFLIFKVLELDIIIVN